MGFSGLSWFGANNTFEVLRAVYKRSSPTGLSVSSMFSRHMSNSGGDPSDTPEGSLGDVPDEGDLNSDNPPVVPSDDVFPRKRFKSKSVVTEETEIPLSDDDDVKSLPTPLPDSHEGLDFSDPKCRSYIDFINDTFIFNRIFDTKVANHIRSWNVVDAIGCRDSFKITSVAAYYDLTKEYASTAFSIWWDVLEYFINSAYDLYDKCGMLSAYDINQITSYAHNQGKLAFIAFYEPMKSVPNSIGYAINGLAMGCHDLVYLLPVVDEKGTWPVNVENECKVSLKLTYNIKGGGDTKEKVSGVTLAINGSEPVIVKCSHQQTFLSDDVDVKRVPQSHTSMKRRSAYDEASLFNVKLDVRDLVVKRYSEGATHNTVFITHGDDSDTANRTVKSSYSKEQAIETIDSHPRFILALYSYVQLSSMNVLNKYSSEQIASYLLGQFIHVLQAGRQSTVNNEIQYASIEVIWTLPSMNSAVISPNDLFRKLVLAGLFRPASKLHFLLFKGFDIDLVKPQIVFATLLNVEFNSKFFDILPYASIESNSMFANFMNIDSKLDVDYMSSIHDDGITASGLGAIFALPSPMYSSSARKEWFVKELAVRQLMGDSIPSNIPLLSNGSIKRFDGYSMPTMAISTECVELTPFKVSDIQEVHDSILCIMFPFEEFRSFRMHYGLIMNNCVILTKSFTP